MIFGPLDAAALLVFVTLFVGVVVYLAMRFKLDLMTWAGLSAASLPPAIYFAWRAGADVGTGAKVVALIGFIWGFALLLMWMRFKTGDLILANQPQKPSSVVETVVGSAEAGQQAGPRDLNSLSIAYLLIGFGIPITAAAVAVFRFLYITGRNGSALATFQPANPAVQICAAALVIGLALLGGGWWFLRRSKRSGSQ